MSPAPARGVTCCVATAVSKVNAGDDWAIRLMSHVSGQIYGPGGIPVLAGETEPKQQPRGSTQSSGRFWGRKGVDVKRCHVTAGGHEDAGVPEGVGRLMINGTSV